MATLTTERLRLLLHYEPSTGLFTRRVQRARRWKPGTAAGGLHPEGYVRVRIDGVGYAAHRLAWLYMTGEWPSGEIDHINRERADNKWCNLREATHSQNQINASIPANNTSGHKGVSWNPARRCWHAYIGAGKKRHLGRFKVLDEAIAARQEAAACLYGEFAV